MSGVGLLTVVSHPSNAVSPEDVQRIVDSTSVVDVRLDEVHAGPVGRVDQAMTVEVEVGEPQVARVDEQNRLLVRFSHSISCHAEGSESEATQLKLWHVVTLDVTEEIEATWPAIAVWIETNVYFLAYPYVRQSVSALTTSLGLPALVLDYLRREERPFSSRRQAD